MSCSSVAKLLPSLTFMFFMFWSYYTFMNPSYWINMNTPATYLLNQIFSNLFFILMVWCFFATLCTGTLRVQTPYKLSAQTLDELFDAKTEEEFNQMIVNYCLANKIRMWTRTETGCIRYCDKCKNIKPDRCYHCSVCNRCVLKKDHHSWLFGQCIGFTNYKLFFCFLFWTSAYLLYILISRSLIVRDVLTNSMSASLSGGPLNFVLLYFLCVILAAYFLYLLIIVNFFQVLNNETGVETWVSPTFIYNQPLTFDVSCGYNCREVFGPNPLLWLLPIPNSPGNSVEYYTSFRGKCNT